MTMAQKRVEDDQPEIKPRVDETRRARPHTWTMSTTDYLLNGALVALVLLQVRGRRLTTWMLLRPIGIVAVIASFYLHGIPTQGNDLVLVVIGATAGHCSEPVAAWQRQECFVTMPTRSSSKPGFSRHSCGLAESAPASLSASTHNMVEARL